jgi:hypothetical protein
VALVALLGLVSWDHRTGVVYVANSSLWLATPHASSSLSLAVSVCLLIQLLRSSGDELPIRLHVGSQNQHNTFQTSST